MFAIIVTYDAAPWIRRCLRSLQANPAPLSVCVVDNASSDNTVSIVRQEFPVAELVPLARNIGFGAANNLGLRKALDDGADFVLLLNQDAALAEGALVEMVRLAQVHPEFGILSPMQFDYEGQMLDRSFCQCVLGGHPEVATDLVKNERRDIYAVSFVPAAIWLIRREVIEAIGGFDPVFFLYGEDNDYVDRTRLAGFTIGVASRASGFHFHTKHQSGRADQLREARGRYAEAVFLLKRGPVCAWRRLVYVARAQVSRLLAAVAMGNVRELRVEWLAASMLLRSAASLRRSVRSGMRIELPADHVGVAKTHEARRIG